MSAAAPVNRILPSHRGRPRLPRGRLSPGLQPGLRLLPQPGRPRTCAPGAAPACRLTRRGPVPGERPGALGGGALRRVAMPASACAPGSPPQGHRHDRFGGALRPLAPSRPFIRGLTVSGGECTLYPDFLTELFTLARAGGWAACWTATAWFPWPPHRADGGVRRG